MQEQSQNATFTFGRFNPVTTGHKKLVDAVVNHARKDKGDHYIFASHSHDKEKNPLTHHQKVGFMKKFFPHANVHEDGNVKTAIDSLKFFHKKGYKKVTMIVGDDRVQEFHNLLHKYNGKEYDIPQLEIKSAGHRDPDAEGVEGMSASKMRAHAKAGEFHHFAKGVPNKAHARDLYNAVRKGMKIENFARSNKALFLVGGPLSGKDIILRSIQEALNILEMPLDKLARSIEEKRNLPELTSNPIMIVNGTAENADNILLTKAVLEHMGYDTGMVFVYTSPEISQHRNEVRKNKGVKTFSEEVRDYKYARSIQTMHECHEKFSTYYIFDNSHEMDHLSEERYRTVNNHLKELGEGINTFFEGKITHGKDVAPKRQYREDPKQLPAPSTPHKSTLRGYDRVKKGSKWVLVPKTTTNESIDDLIEKIVDDSPTENPMTIMAQRVPKKKKGDATTGIAMSSKNMAVPPVWEENETKKPKKKGKTKSATPPPQFFDSRMGVVPSGGVGLASSYVPTKGKLFSEVRRNTLSIARNIDDEE